MKSEGLFSTGNATNLLCAFLYQNCTDSTGRLQGAQSLAFHLPQPCQASWPAPIPLLLPAPQRTEGSWVVKVEAESGAVPLVLPVLFGMLVPCSSGEAQGSPASLTYRLAG